MEITEDQSLWIVSYYLNFHPHLLSSQTRDSSAGPKRLVVGQVLAKVTNHVAEGLVVDGDVVGDDFEDLGNGVRVRLRREERERLLMLEIAPNCQERLTCVTDLGPSLAPSVLEVELDIPEGL